MKNIIPKLSFLFSFVSKASIFLLVFLIPVFFLPWTSDVLNFNKQALLIFLSFISVFALILKILFSNKIEFRFSKLYLPIFLFLIIYLISALGSLWRYGSFWGWPLSSKSALISLFCFFLVYLIIANTFSQKDVFNLLIVLFFSGLLSSVFSILQMFRKFVFPFAFSKISSFNTIGGMNDLALLVVFFAFLSILLILLTKRIFLKIIFFLSFFLFFFVLLLINFKISWWLMAIGFVLFLVFALSKRIFLSSHWLLFLMFFLVVSFIFIFFNLPLFENLPLPFEFYLKAKTSFDIAFNVLKDRVLFGSGPGTFIYDFSKHKPIELNNTSLWNIRFGRASSEIMNIAATTGIIGLLSFFFLLFSFFFGGLKFVFINKDKKEILPEEEKKRILGVCLFLIFLLIVFGLFLYSFSFVLNFVFFIILAGLTVLIAPPKKELVFKPSSLPAFIFAFFFTLVFVLELGIVIFEAKRYIADVNYHIGVKTWNNAQNEEALKRFEKAVKINPAVDVYWRELAQAYFQRIDIEAKRTDIEKEELSQIIQALISNSVNSAKVATDVNPKNPVNWSVRGYIYQNLIGVIPSVEQWAEKTYDEALNLEPLNPYYLLQQGLIYLSEYNNFLKQGKGKDSPEIKEILSKAQKKFERAIEIKSDYGAARFYLANVYNLEGKRKEAIEELKEAEKKSPFDFALPFQLGLIYFQNNDYDKAQIEFEKAVVLNPNYANALYFLGLTYDQQGKREKAIEKIEKVLSLNPGNKEAGKVLENLKSGRKALEGIIETPIIESKPEEIPEEMLEPEEMNSSQK